MKETIQWISAEKKPDTDVTVLCWADDEYFCGWWDSEINAWRDSLATPGVTVTYWCEICGPMVGA